MVLKSTRPYVRQMKQAVYQPEAAAQCQTEETFDAQAKLDGRIRKDLLATTSTAAYRCQTRASATLGP